jgi:hypothetical protein
MRAAFRIAWWRPLARLASWLSASRGIPAPPVRWHKTSGPYFGNAVATLDVRGREANVTIERSRHGAGGPELVPLPPVPLTGPPRP